MVKISVIMGVYNMSAKKYIMNLAVQSILNQSFRDFEFIICDDGSTDETYEHLTSLAKFDDRIVLIRNEKNRGLAYSLNRCIEQARGQYIARMDADDISLPKRLEIEYNFLMVHTEYALVSCWANLFDENGVWGLRKGKEKPQKEDLLFGPPFIHPSVMIKKSVLLNLKGYRVAPETTRAEDYDLWMRLYAAGFCGYILPQILFEFREDKDAYKRRTYKHRVEEMKVRYNGFKMLKLYPKAWIYVIKPLIVGIFPQKMLSRLRNEKIH